MNHLSKTQFINLINNYYPTMNFYELIRLYFKIIDNIQTNYIPKKNNKDVFNRLYSQRPLPNKQCCTKHCTLKNIQKILKYKMNKTKYEKKKYIYADLFYNHIVKEMKKIILSNMIFNINDYSQKYKFIKYIKNKKYKWGELGKYIIFNRNGKLLKIDPRIYIIPPET